MQSLELKNGISWIGALDPDLRVFDVVMETEFGTSYNSYFVEGSEKIAVAETVKVKFWDEYIEKLSNQIDPKEIDYIIVDHTEPDHAGSVEKLLDLATNAKVVGSSTAIQFLEAIANREFESMIVNTGDEIDLGNKTLEFISAPFLHWPDSMYTYVKEDKTLITGDSFGSHYSFDKILRSKLEEHDDYFKALEYYYNMIMGPFKPYVLDAISKIEDIEINMICPAHGPILDENPWEIVEKYREWSTEENPNTKETVIIPYVSAYGYTGQLAQKIKEGIKSVGDIEVEVFDLVKDDEDEVLNKIRWADGLLFGSPTINSDALPPIWDLLMSLSPVVHGGKLASAFGSFGWSGEAVPNLEERLEQLRMKIMPGLKVNFKPNEEELEKAYEFGAQFGEYIADEDKEPPAVNRGKGKDDNLDVDGTVKKWRCVICGEVYEGVEPPAVCPACGASAEQFEVYEEEEIEFQSKIEEDIVIIGNNAAGTAAAESIRARNKKASVRIIDKDPHPAYYRPILSDYISNSHDEEQFYLYEEEWYEKNNIHLTLGETVSKINPDDDVVDLENGEKVKYDKLILATGSHNFIPPIIDINKQRVFTIKTIDDADQVKKYAEKSKEVVVIGGGLLGLEAAWELKSIGLDVTVVERSECILPKQLDVQGSQMLERGIHKSGVEIIKGATVNAILGNQEVDGVQLSSGNRLDADMVIVSAGIRPNTELAKEAGIEVDYGIVTDATMKTNIDNIYAAGDVSQFEGVNYGIWPEAIEQGKVAGANVVGDKVEYEHVIPSNVFNGMNMKLFSVGDLNFEDDVSYKSIIDQDPEENIYKKLYFIDEEFVGGILIGDVVKTSSMITGIKRGASAADMIDEIILD